MNFDLLFCSTIALSFTVASLIGLGVPAAADPNIAVYIECSNGTENRQGSGILVGPNGHVLTARHVAPDGFSCNGAVGNNTNALRGMIVDSQDGFLPEKYDARLLRFVANRGETFDFAHYCPVGAHLQGARIRAFGWHSRKKGYPSQTQGILSSHLASARGIVETDALSSSGKSGGPVFLEGSRDIVGIVVGAEFDFNGTPIFFGVLDASIPARNFSIMSTGDACSNGRGQGQPPVSSVDDHELAWKEYDQAKYFFDRKEYQRAIPFLDKAIELDGENSEFYNLRAISYRQMENYHWAIADYGQAIFLNPTDSVLYANRANSYYQINEYGKALRDIERSLELNFKDAYPYELRGDIRLKTGDYDRAAEDYRSALHYEPDNDDLAADVGYAYFKLGQWATAASYFSEAIRLNPGRALYYYDRGNMYYRLDDFVGAGRDYQTVLQLDPNHTQAREALDDLCNSGRFC